MLALVKNEATEGLSLMEVAEPEIGHDDVLIEVSKAGICGTDLHIYNWDDWASKTVPVPLVVGHEFVGRVIEVGSGVTDFRVGDVVSGEGHVVCGRCRNCMAGRRHLCNDTSGIGVTRPGAFAERIALPVTNIWVHDKAVSEEVAAIFDPFGNAVHSALSFPVLGEDVLITGAGPIGLMAASVVRHAGARHVVITDVNPYRLKLAQDMGATLAVNAEEKRIKDVQKELGMEEGFDVGLEMSGNPKAFQELLSNMCHGGKVAMLGIPEGEMAIDWNLVVFNMLTIKGIYGREMYETWYKMTVMLQSGLEVSPVITHRFSFENFQEAFETALSGQSGKILLEW
jgi:threonine 3-dehydrogenase